MIRLPVQGISQIGRNTQGVWLINLGTGDRVIDMSRIVQNGADEDQEREDGGAEEKLEGPGGNGTPPVADDGQS